MDISINGKNADITLDTEKTLGDVLSGLEQWISTSGNRIREIRADGKILGDENLAEAFNSDVGGIKKLDIVLSSWVELAAEALGALTSVCGMYANAGFDERPSIAASWEENAAARFLKSDISDIYDLAKMTLKGEGLTASDLSILIEERLRELTSVEQEIAGCETLVRTIAQRMEELSLDIQTGKASRAAETVQLFSRVGEKLFRIFFILKSMDLSADTFIIDGVSARTFIDEFKAALLELTGAYESRDTVLVGDLAEYELSPRLLKFFSALKDHTVSPGPP